MRQLLLVIILVFLGIAVWRIADSLSSDAIGLAVGVIFGVLAGLPTAMLVLAGNRRDRSEDRGPRQPGPYGYGMQPPVIVLAAPAAHTALSDQSHALPAAETPATRPRRHFEFIGVQEGTDDELASHGTAHRR